MTWHCLATLSPYDPVLDARVPVYLASANLREITGLGGRRWEPAMTAPPTTSLELFQGDLRDAVKPGGARLPISLTRTRKSHAHIDRAYWPGAAVEIRIGRVGDVWPWPVHFVGRVTTFSREKDVLALACEVDEAPFRANILTANYAGTGGAEGGDDLKGRPKPLVMGWAQSVEPVLIDAVNSVYQFSGYGPIEAVDVLYERAADFGDSLGDHASYTALVAATIPGGRWATCLAEGMVRLGAPAYGVITGDVKGHEVAGATPRLAGAMIQVLAALAGVDPDLIATGTFNGMDAVAPYPTNVLFDSQATVIDAARRMALPCNHQCGIGLTGKLFATAIGVIEGSLLTLHAQGKAAPQVVETKELAVSPPFARTMLGANRAWRVHTADEIAFDAPIVPLGAYDDTATYRLGNVVSSPDQSEWIYVFDDPTVGNDPPAWPTASNTWWSNTKPPVTAANVKYASGDSVEDLQPAEPASDVTSSIPTVPETVVQCDYLGAPKAGQLPRNVQFTLIRNGLDVTDQATWSVGILSGAGTVPTDVSISNASGTEGRLTLTNVATDLVLEIEADFGAGTAVRTAEHKVRRQLDAAPSTGGGGSGAGGSDYASIDGTVFGTTLAPIAPYVDVTVGAGGDIDLSAEIYFSSDQASGSQSENARWYKWNGASDVAIGTLQGSESAFVPSFGFPGQGRCDETDTGNTPASAQRYRLYGAAGGGSYTVFFSGVCSAVAAN